MDELIEGYVDRAKFSSDTKFIEDELTRVAELQSRLGGFRLQLQGAKTVNEISTATEGAALTSAKFQKVLVDVARNVDTLTEKQKEHIRVIYDQFKAEEQLRAGAKETAGLITKIIGVTEKLDAVQTDQAKQLAIGNIHLKKQNDLNKAEAQIQATVEGSIKRAEAVRSRLLLIQKDINVSTDAGAQKSANYKKKIDELNEFIGKNSDALTKQKINIGNYVGSAKIIVDALEKEKIKLQSLTSAYQTFGQTVTQNRATIQGFGGSASKGGETQALQNNIASTTSEMKKLETEMDHARTKIEGFSRITDSPKFLNIAGKVGDATAELKFFTKSLIDLERQGLGSSDAAKALRKSMAELTDQISDAKAEVKALSSDTRSFDLLAGSVSFAADVFQTFAGAAVLAGASEEDAAEATKNLVAVQSVANGVKGIANELTTRGTAANKVYAFAQAQVATAMDVTATAGARLKAVLVTIGIGALIIGIGLLVANFGKIKDAFSGITPQQRLFNDLNKEAAQAAGAESGQLKVLRATIESTEVPMATRLQAIKNLKEQFPTLFDGLTNEELLTGKAADAYNRAAAAILKKAQASAAAAAIEKNAEKELKILQEQREDDLKVQDKLQKGSKSKDLQREILGDDVEVFAALWADRRKDREKDLEQIKKDNDFLLGIAVAGADQTIKTDKDPKTKAAAKGPKDTSKEDALKAQLDNVTKTHAAQKALALENANEVIRINQLVVDNDKATLKDKTLSLEEIATQKRKIAAIELADALAAEVKIEKGKLEITEKSNDEKLLAQEQFANKEKAINDDLLKAQQTAQKENTEKILAEVERLREEKLKKLDSDTDLLRAGDEQQFNDAVIALNARFEAGKISQETYDKERAKLESDFQLASLQREIEYQKALIEISDLPADKKAEALRKLADLERQLSDATKANHLKNEGEKLAGTIKTLNDIQAGSQKVFEFIGGLLNADAITKKNKLKEETDEQEKKAARDIERVNASAESEQDKAAKIIVINARLTAQKDLAAQKQKKIDEQQAKFAKAVAIFNIILSTAQAVIGFLAKANIPGAILAGIAGAAQLAVAIATPIPKFKHGKNMDNYEGPAIVNDGHGPEVIERSDGSIEFPKGRNVLTYVGKNDIIHPDKDAWLNAILNAANRDAAHGMKFAPAKDKNEVVEAIEKQNVLLNKIANKRENHLSAKDGALVSLWKHGANVTSYIQESTNW